MDFPSGTCRGCTFVPVRDKYKLKIQWLYLEDFLWKYFLRPEFAAVPEGVHVMHVHAARASAVFGMGPTSHPHQLCDCLYFQL